MFNVRKLLCGSVAALGLLALSLGQASAASRLEQSVSSDGAREMAPDVASRLRGVSSNSGTDAEVISAPESAGEFARLKGLRAVSAREGRESIIGADNRFRINPTTTFPARAVVLITFSAGRCTGWLINANTVITAGHCVSPGNNTGFYPRASFRVYPGRNGGVSPYGSCTAKRLYSVTGWTTNGNEEFDYGAIKLNCSVGNTTGWFGFWWQSASLNGLFTRVSGYPGDKPLTQWQSTDQVRATTTNQVFYANDTVGGNSGGPVWQNRGSTASFCQGVCALAVHAYGLHGFFPHNTYNHGSRITQARFNNFIAWRNAP